MYTRVIVVKGQTHSQTDVYVVRNVYDKVANNLLLFYYSLRSNKLVKVGIKT